MPSVSVRMSEVRFGDERRGLPFGHRGRDRFGRSFRRRRDDRCWGRGCRLRGIASASRACCKQQPRGQTDDDERPRSRGGLAKHEHPWLRAVYQHQRGGLLARVRSPGRSSLWAGAIGTDRSVCAKAATYGGMPHWCDGTCARSIGPMRLRPLFVSPRSHSRVADVAASPR